MDLHCFMMYEEAVKKSGNKEVVSVLENMMRLFAVDKILSKTEGLIEFDLITPKQVKVLREIKLKLLPVIKREVR